ncbi:MAG: alpha/beta hydrolase [Nocardioides sp.]
MFRLLELVAPALGALWANRIWFRIPAAPQREVDLPPGSPFEVESQGRTVRGTVWGEGPVVYLVHGWGGRGTDLAPFVRPLLEHGRRVVTFDAPSHGVSDAGALGRRRTHGVEVGRAFDAVAARFGPAEAVVAHSMGAVVTLLTLKYGWLGAGRIVLVAPMTRLASQLAAFRVALGIGRRTEARMDRAIHRMVGHPVGEFEVAGLYEEVGPLPMLLVHDKADRTTPYTASLDLSTRTGARVLTTSGLGHHRVLRDPAVVGAVVDFVVGAPSDLETVRSAPGGRAA